MVCILLRLAVFFTEPNSLEISSRLKVSIIHLLLWLSRIWWYVPQCNHSPIQGRLGCSQHGTLMTKAVAEFCVNVSSLIPGSAIAGSNGNGIFRLSLKTAKLFFSMVIPSCRPTSNV